MVDAEFQRQKAFLVKTAGDVENVMTGFFLKFINKKTIFFKSVFAQI